jgi:hypothetical protein
MRPFLTHGAVLAALAALGAVLFVGEALSTQGAGWVIGRFTLTKVYWLALAGYALASTLIVVAVGLFLRRRERPLSHRVVVLSHVVPAALVWVLVSLGAHDAIQDLVRDAAHGRDWGPTPAGEAGKARAPASSAPSTMVRKYGSGGEPVGAQRQDVR